MTGYTYNENWHLNDPGVLLHHDWIGKQLNPFRPVTMFGAVGDGLTDDTGHIQDALNAVPNLYFPGPATYLIDATVGLRPQSYQHIFLHPQAVIQVAPTSAPSYHAFLLDTVTQVHLRGGQIIGDRATHIGSTGEAGIGISLSAATSIRMEEMAISECWGDGLYIAGSCQDIHLRRVTSSHNRRQGLSLIRVDGFTAEHCAFMNTDGVSPQSGVDLEPNGPADIIQNILFTHCSFDTNTGYGLVIAGGAGTVRRVRLVNCHSQNNAVGCFFNQCSQIQIHDGGSYGNTFYGWGMSNVSDILMTGLHGRDNLRFGVMVGDEGGTGATNILLANSMMTANHYGVWINPETDGLSLIGNRLTGNSTANLHTEPGAQNITNVGNVAP